MNQGEDYSRNYASFRTKEIQKNSKKNKKNMEIEIENAYIIEVKEASLTNSSQGKIIR